MRIFELGLNAFCTILLQAYGCQGMECGSVNVIRAHNLTGSSTIRRGFVGVSMALLEEVCYCGSGL